jgi:hypothetical protein
MEAYLWTDTFKDIDQTREILASDMIASSRGGVAWIATDGGWQVRAQADRGRVDYRLFSDDFRDETTAGQVNRP